MPALKVSKRERERASVLSLSLCMVSLFFQTHQQWSHLLLVTILCMIRVYSIKLLFLTHMWLSCPPVSLLPFVVFTSFACCLYLLASILLPLLSACGWQWNHATFNYAWHDIPMFVLVSGGGPFPKAAPWLQGKWQFHLSQFNVCDSLYPLYRLVFASAKLVGSCTVIAYTLACALQWCHHMLCV